VDIVNDAAERLERKWGRQLGRVEFGIETVPPSDPAPWERGVALGRLFPSDLGQPTRIVVYRRPIELRAEGDEVAALVRDVLAENVAHLLGRSPEEVDGDYGTGPGT
jgi:predicted Zn-dependent protease with MMP-like domain